MVATSLDVPAVIEFRVADGFEEDVQALLVGGLLRDSSAEHEVTEDLLAFVQRRPRRLPNQARDAIQRPVTRDQDRVRLGKGNAEVQSHGYTNRFVSASCSSQPSAGRSLAADC